MKRIGTTFVEVVVVFVVLLVIVFMCSGVFSLLFRGRGASEVAEIQSLDSNGNGKYAGKSGPLSGSKWESLAGHWKGSVIAFSEGGNFHLALKGPYSKEPDDEYGRYSVLGRTIKVGPESGPWNIYDPEFPTEDEMLLIHVSKETYCGFEQLEGRWKRITPQQSTGPIADAKQQVQRIEQKLSKLETVLDSTHKERDELAEKLRSVGVNSAADLSDNTRGKRLAENVVTIGTEIESLERQIAGIETDLLKARSIVRRMEREQAGLSEKEITELTLQLRLSEERTDGAPLPVTPLDIDAAVEKVLKTSAK